MFDLDNKKIEDDCRQIEDNNTYIKSLYLKFLQLEKIIPKEFQNLITDN